MSDDRSRATSGGPVRPGNVGRADPSADPATDPSLRAVTPSDPSGGPTVPVATGGGVIAETPLSEQPTAALPTPTAPPRPPAVKRTRVSGLWIGLILSALVGIFLLIFILQNLDLVQIHFLGAAGSLPAGVALLFAAIAGALLVAIPGTGRIIQLRRAARRSRSGKV